MLRKSNCKTRIYDLSYIPLQNLEKTNNFPFGYLKFVLTLTMAINVFEKEALTWMPAVDVVFY